MKVIFILYLFLSCQILTASCNESTNSINESTNSIIDADANAKKAIADSSNVEKNEDFIEKEYCSIIIKIKSRAYDLLPYEARTADFNYLEDYLNRYYEKGYELHSIIPVETTGYKIGLVYTSEIIIIFKKMHNEKN